MAMMLLKMADRYEELESQAYSEPLKVTTLEVDVNNRKVVTYAHANKANIEYSFALYGPRGIKIVHKFGPYNNSVFHDLRDGTYRVWVQIRDIENAQDIILKKSAEFTIKG